MTTPYMSQPGGGGPVPLQGIAQDYAPQIQQMLNQATAGQVLTLPAGLFPVASGLTIPQGVTLAGGRGGKETVLGTILQPTAAFAAAQVIGFPAGTSEQQIRDLVIDGSLMPAGTSIGISAAGGQAEYVQLSNVLMSGAGLSNGVSVAASGWLARDVIVRGTSSTGIVLASVGDHNWTDSQVINAGSYGWSLSGIGNSKFTACRADWSAAAGWFIQGAWSTGTGAGGIQLTACSTDRNAQDGVLISATGTSPILITGHMGRRDGSSSTSAGYAAVRIGAAATVPVVIDGITTYPGVNDDGTGNDSPEYGINYQATGGYAQLTNAYLHAVTAGTTGTIPNYRAIATRTGSTSAPGAITQVADSS